MSFSNLLLVSAINMPETSKRFENDITPQASLPLKERLLVFRARYLGKILPNIPKPAPGRLGDILKPLQQVIREVRPEREAGFLRLVEKLQNEKLIEKADSIEAQILITLTKLKSKIERGAIPVKAITDVFNEERAEKYRLTYQRVGRRLSAMGFEKVRTNTGASAIIWDEEKVERMRVSYGLRKTSETPDTSEIPAIQAGITDLFDDTDVCRNPR